MCENHLQPFDDPLLTGSIQQYPNYRKLTLENESYRILVYYLGTDYEQRKAQKNFKGSDLLIQVCEQQAESPHLAVRLAETEAAFGMELDRVWVPLEQVEAFQTGISRAVQTLRGLRTTLRWQFPGLLDEREG